MPERSLRDALAAALQQALLAEPRPAETSLRVRIALHTAAELARRRLLWSGGRSVCPPAGRRPRRPGAVVLAHLRPGAGPAPGRDRPDPTGTPLPSLSGFDPLKGRGLSLRRTGRCPAYSERGQVHTRLPHSPERHSHLRPRPSPDASGPAVRSDRRSARPASYSSSTTIAWPRTSGIVTCT